MSSLNFDTEKFFKPDNSFYPVYSWVWNEVLSKDEIKRQLDKMYERSIRGVYVIPLPREFRPKTMLTNLEPAYLSDGYFEMLSFAADYARCKNMNFWLYDEGGWPSGNANGLVTKKDKKLRLTHIDKGRLKTISRADLTNIEATEKFIALTHDRHKTKMGKSFCSLGPVVFTDEPGISALPFTKSIKEEYKKRTGKALSLRKIKKHNNPELNIIYHDICSELFARNYFAPIKKWCNENGLLSAGHLDKDNEPYGFKKSFHHPLRQLRLLDIPGIDAIWGQIEPCRDCGFFPRLASSAAEQSGSGLSLTESLSVYGTMTYEQMRYVLGYQLVRGINILNLMLLMYDENGYYSIRQRPAFSDKLPSAEQLSAFNCYMASLQYLMQCGVPDTACAVYLPMRSLWADEDDTKAALFNYEEAGRKIERSHGQFDIIDDDLILCSDSEKLKKGILSMGRAEYKIVYIPADKYMPEEVKLRLEAFRNGGGKIYYKGEQEYFPTLEISDDNEQLRVHKRKYSNCEIYLIFNEGSGKVNAKIQLPDGAMELDALNKKIYSANEGYCFESGEIKVFIVKNDESTEEKAPQKGKKICTLTDFRIKQIKKFTLNQNGMNYTDVNNEETTASCGNWSELFGEDFSGKCQYRTNFTFDGEAKDLILSLGKVCYSCEIILNGTRVADLFMPPYETCIDKALLQKNNELVINVSNTAANAFVHFDLPEEWEQKHIGPYHEKALELEKKLLGGGISGEINIYEAL